MDMNSRFSQEMYMEYEKLRIRVSQPKVVIDNKSRKNATVIRINCANRHGLLLKFVQVLTDLNLNIIKAKVASDCDWYMDVFHVTDHEGNKITDDKTLNYIQECLGSDSSFLFSVSSVEVKSSADCTAIELIGSDRPGLLSEVSAVLTHLKCNIMGGEVWTHNTRAAAVLHIIDQDTRSAITDPQRLFLMESQLYNVLKGSNKLRDAKSVVSVGVRHTDRRLHQLMFADRDYERSNNDVLDEQQRPNVNVYNWSKKNYTVITIQCKDRPKLLFDTICTLTDMDYVVFHASFDAEGPEAYQEYYVRHVDGSPVNSDAERDRVIECLEAAIKRRVSDGVRLELCTKDRVGLLSNITRIFREFSLTLIRTEVKTMGSEAVDTFYIRDASGKPVDPNTIITIQQRVGQELLKVKGSPEESKQETKQFFGRFLLGELLPSLFKCKPFVNTRSVRPISLF